MSWFSRLPSFRSSRRSNRARRRTLKLERFENRELFAIDALGPAIDVESGNLSESSGDVAMFGDGGSIAVYARGRDIWGRLYDGRKVPVGNEFLVAQSPSSSITYLSPQVAASSSDLWAVAFEEFDNTTSDTDVRFRLFNGQSVVTGNQVNPTDTAKDQGSPKIAMDSQGNFVVIYVHTFATLDNDIYYRVYNSSGSGLATAATVSGAGGSADEYNPTVAMSRDGTRFGVAWQEAQGAVSNVRASIYEKNGTTISTVATDFSVPDSDVGVDNMQRPTAAMDDDGDMAIAWIHEIGNNEEILKRTFNRSGVGATAIPVVASQADLTSPDIAVGHDAFVDYVVAYQTSDNARVAGVVDTFTTFNLDVSSNSWAERIPRVAMQGQSFTVVYLDRQNTVNNVKAKLFGQVGLPGRDSNDVGGYIGANGSLWIATTALGQDVPLISTSVGALNPAAGWRDYQSAVFTSDDRSGFAARTASGQWWVVTADGINLWTTWNPSAGWVDVQSGDVNGDGLADIVGRTSGGEWWAAISTGSSFTNVKLTTWSNAVVWQDVLVGDFNGDFKDDIVGRVKSSGQVWFALATGSVANPTLSNVLATTWSPAVTWTEVRVGDYNGDGTDDLAGRAGGAWWVGISNGASLNTTFWGVWSTAVNWVDVKVGDFDGDGKDDISGRISGSGVWWVARSTGTSLVNENWVSYGITTWSLTQIVDLNNDGRNDILSWDSSTGRWWASLSNGKVFKSYVWGVWSNAVTWTYATSGEFN